MCETSGSQNKIFPKLRMLQRPMVRWRPRYFQNTFLKILGVNVPSTYDDHVTHISVKVIELAIQRNVTIIKLPSRSSHVLQPWIFQLSSHLNQNGMQNSYLSSKKMLEKRLQVSSEISGCKLIPT